MQPLLHAAAALAVDASSTLASHFLFPLLPAGLGPLAAAAAESAASSAPPPAARAPPPPPLPPAEPTWTLYGRSYSLLDFASQHPGGSLALLLGADLPGGDATALFEQYHAFCPAAARAALRARARADASARGASAAAAAAAGAAAAPPRPPPKSPLPQPPQPPKPPAAAAAARAP